MPPAARPPVSSIAERAAARAKARNTRRAVVGIAASIAMVAGGIAVWNALDDDQPPEVIVVDQSPTTPEPVPTTAPIERPPDEARGCDPERARRQHRTGHTGESVHRAGARMDGVRPGLCVRR